MAKRLMTLNRHIAEAERWHPEATGTFTRLLWDLSLAARVISREVNMAGLAKIIGSTGTENTTGDAQQKLDVFAEEQLVALGAGGYLCVLASEEQEDVIPVPDGFPVGSYVFVFDPLDGSSNIDVNTSVGTIFGIYRRLDPGAAGQGTLADVLQKGSELVAAGYIVYGSSTMLVYSTGQGVHGFTLDPSLGEFVLSHPSIRIPKSGSTYSVNEGNAYRWPEGPRRFVEWIKRPDPETGKQAYRQRYIGTMAADFHRTLLQGGIFLYPGIISSSTGKEKYKLRLVYECNPMGWLCEQAGGRATTGTEKVTDLAVESLHQTIAFAAGSPDE
ncbi:MAG: class 1 fructose-bisphosphatase, partial [Planctomycetota bacterium]